MLTPNDVSHHGARARVAGHCASLAGELLDLLVQLPPGHPLEAACLEGVRGAEAALHRLGLRLSME